MKQIIFLLLVMSSNKLLASDNKSYTCPLDGWTTEQITQFIDNKFTIENQNLDQLSLSMMGCLASHDPYIRDEVGYMSYVTWLREQKPSESTIRALFNRFTEQMNQRRNDEHQVYLPFLTLVYAELVRVDRITPYLTEQELQRAVTAISSLLLEADDFRGFDGKIGWRHLVAHSADVTLQLILNKRLTKSQHDELLVALYSKIAPENHSYRFGESKRFVTPIVYSWMAEKHDLTEWQAMLNQLIDPSPFASWQDVYKSEAGLHKLHNTRLYLLELYRLVSFNNVDRLNQLEKSVKAALTKLG
ncbi:MAG: DUF2785 domain-containing protein [Gammaproteobacteria bacterium]|nr:DUF2785 domain-containing protein [Gammaproteobacteria bacterium]